MHDLRRTHRAEERAERIDERFRLQPVEELVSRAPLLDEAGAEEHREVPRDRGPRDVEPRRDLAGRELPLAEVFQDLAPGGVDDGAEDVAAHACYISYLAKLLQAKKDIPVTPEFHA